MNPKVISLLEEILSILTKDELNIKSYNDYCKENNHENKQPKYKMSLANEELEDKHYLKQAHKQFNERLNSKVIDDFINEKPKKDYEILIGSGVWDYFNNCVIYKEIQSVIRVSDNQIFSIGDKLEHIQDGKINTATIERFVDNKSKMCFIDAECKNSCKDLKNYTKVKQPIKLFTEEQMKECFHESGAIEDMGGGSFRRKYTTFQDYKEQKLNKQ